MHNLYLSVFIQDVPKEAVCIWETLWTSTLSNTDHTVLFWMQHTALRW